LRPLFAGRCQATQAQSIALSKTWYMIHTCALH
jgi:hypothetical protein